MSLLYSLLWFRYRPITWRKRRFRRYGLAHEMFELKLGPKSRAIDTEGQISRNTLAPFSGYDTIPSVAYVCVPVHI